MRKPGSAVSLLLPRLQDLVFLSIFAAAILTGRDMLNTDSDLGRHLTLGRTMLATLHVPTHDVLSHTLAGGSRPPYEWLAQVLFAAADRMLGLDGVVLLTALTLAAAFRLIYRESVRRSGMPLLALLFTLWAAVASSIHWLTRPHVFSFLLLAIWLGQLEMLRTDGKVRLWHLPLLMLVWANTHGGFVYGLLAWLAYFAGWLWQAWRGTALPGSGRQWLVTGVASLAATILTPGGWHNWEAVLANRSRFILSRTVETMPPDFLSPGIWPFAALGVAALILLLVERRRVAGQHLILLAGLGGISLLMVRHIPLFAIAAAPILTSWAGEAAAAFWTWQRFEAGIRRIDEAPAALVWPILAPAIVAGLFVSHFQSAGRAVFEFDPRIFPVGAADWVSGHPPAGKMYNDFNWGGYLLYRLWPQQKVFVDSQSDFYGEPFMRRYETILLGGRDWEHELDLYAVDWILIPPSTGLAHAARESGAWSVLFEDQVAIVLVRKSTAADHGLPILQKPRQSP